MGHISEKSVGFHGKIYKREPYPPENERAQYAHKETAHRTRKDKNRQIIGDLRSGGDKSRTGKLHQVMGNAAENACFDDGQAF